MPACGTKLNHEKIMNCRRLKPADVKIVFKACTNIQCSGHSFFHSFPVYLSLYNTDGIIKKCDGLADVSQEALAMATKHFRHGEISGACVGSGNPILYFKNMGTQSEEYGNQHFSLSRMNIYILLKIISVSINQ